MVVSEQIDNEELAAFVSSTLNGIAKGVENSSADTRVFNVPIKVEFEVAVTATRSNDVSGGLKLQIFNVAGKNNLSGETVSRVKFEVLSHSKGGSGRLDTSRLGGGIV
jgi:hypothetical protein